MLNWSSGFLQESGRGACAVPRSYLVDDALFSWWVLSTWVVIVCVFAFFALLGDFERVGTQDRTLGAPTCTALELKVFIFFFLAVTQSLWNLSFQIRDWNLGPQQWKCRVLTAGPPGNSQFKVFWLWLTERNIFCSTCTHVDKFQQDAETNV